MCAFRSLSVSTPLHIVNRCWSGFPCKWRYINVTTFNLLTFGLFCGLLDGDLTRSKHKSRSQSLSTSFRNLFRRGKHSVGGSGDASRESSLTRGGPTFRRDDSTATPSPQLSTASRTHDPPRHHHTPEYTPRSYQSYASGGTPVLQARPSPLPQR